MAGPNGNPYNARGYVLQLFLVPPTVLSEGGGVRVGIGGGGGGGGGT